MLIGLNIDVATLLVLGHLLVTVLAIWALVREHGYRRRNAWLAAYTYVAFISLLSVATTSPWEMGGSLELIRNVAVVFFVVGVIQTYYCKKRARSL